MYANKDSNLISYLRTKHGEENVRLLRKWEITVKKMADYKNHRRFTLKCIKASITPVGHKLKNPLMTKRSYEIIHKAEKQLLYERIRNINNTLEMFEKNRSQYFCCLKNMVNPHDQDSDINKCILFINKIKEHRHSKIKEKHINKFEHLYFKRFGYHHNLNRQMQNIDSIDQDCTLSRHLNVPSSFSDTFSQASSNSAGPATPTAPTPSSSADPAPVATTATPGNPPFSLTDTCKTSNHTKKWVINLSKTPSLQNSYPFYKKAHTLPKLPSPPIEVYITLVEQASSKLPAQEADELRSDVNQLLKQEQT